MKEDIEKLMTLTVQLQIVASGINNEELDDLLLEQYETVDNMYKTKTGE